MSKLNLNLSQWAAGRGRYGVGWSVYKNGEEVNWSDCQPLTRWGARLAARRFARRERHGKPVPPYGQQLTVVSEPTIPHRDLRTISRRATP